MLQLKNTKEEPLVASRKKIRRPSHKIFAFMKRKVSGNYEGGNDEANYIPIMLSVYQLVGNFNYVRMVFVNKGMSALAAQVLAATVSFVADEVVG